MVDIINGRHGELEKAEFRKGEDSVQRVLAAARNVTNYKLPNTSGPLCLRSRCVNCPQSTETKRRMIREWCCTANAPQPLHGYKNAVVKRFDTDIFVFLLSPAHTPSSKLTVYNDTGSGKHQQLINLSDLAVSLGEDYCATLLGMYVFSGEECTNAFKEKEVDGAVEKTGEENQVL